MMFNRKNNIKFELNKYEAIEENDAPMKTPTQTDRLNQASLKVWRPVDRGIIQYISICRV